jgi:hypothetical protein
MRRAKTVLAVLALLLFDCGRKQPDFDERYATARQKLEASAAAIDNDIVASASASDAAAAATVGLEKPGG